MCSRPREYRISEPRQKMISSGQISLPHCWLNGDTSLGTRSNSRLTPRFDGLNRCRPWTRIAYFEEIDSRLQMMYGHSRFDRTRMPTLMPVMYALAMCGHFPVAYRLSSISRAMALAIARPV